MKIELLSYPFDRNLFRDRVWNIFCDDIPFMFVGETLLDLNNDITYFYNHHYGSWESRCRRYVLLLAEVDGTPQIVFREEEEKTFFDITLPYFWKFSEKVQNKKEIRAKSKLPLLSSLEKELGMSLKNKPRIIRCDNEMERQQVRSHPTSFQTYTPERFLTRRCGVDDSRLIRRFADACREVAAMQSEGAWALDLYDGDDIRYEYHNTDLYGTSCMSDETEILDFYCENYRVVELVSIVGPNGTGGRAILWKDDEGNRLLDRFYCQSEWTPAQIRTIAIGLLKKEKNIDVIDLYPPGCSGPERKAYDSCITAEMPYNHCYMPWLDCMNAGVFLPGRPIKPRSRVLLHFGQQYTGKEEAEERHQELREKYADEIGVSKHRIEVLNFMEQSGGPLGESGFPFVCSITGIPMKERDYYLLGRPGIDWDPKKVDDPDYFPELTIHYTTICDGDVKVVQSVNPLINANHSSYYVLAKDAIRSEDDQWWYYKEDLPESMKNVETTVSI